MLDRAAIAGARMWKEAFSGWPRGLIMTIAAAGFLTPLARGQTVQLNSNPAFAGSSNGVEADFIITPDSKRVIYRAELTTDDSEDLYSASTTAANTQIQLSNTMAAGDFVQSFALSPDSGAVVFGRLIKAASRFDLMRASTTAAGTQMTLSEDVARNYFSKVLMTPDGSKVVFWGAKSVGFEEIYSTSATTPATPLKISSPFPQFESIGTSALVTTPAGYRLIFTGEFNTEGVREIFSVPLDKAGAQITLNSPPVENGSVADTPTSRFAVTPDGSTVLYGGDVRVENAFELFKASTTAAGSQTRISSSSNPAGDALGFLMLPDGSKALYPGDLDQDEVYALYEASVQGPPNQKKVYDLTTQYAGARSISITPDGKQLILLGSLTTPGIDELYTAPTTFLVEPRRLTSLSGTKEVESFLYSSDGSFVVYEQVDHATNAHSLWVVATSGAYAPVQIAPPPQSPLLIASYQLRPDDGAVVYTAYVDKVFVQNLFSVPVPALNTQANPNPPGAPVSAPSNPTGPKKSNAAPTVQILGKKKVSAKGKPVTIKGTATDDRAVTSVLVTYKKVSASGKKKKVTKLAKLAGGAWKFKFRPTGKVTKLTFQAVDAQGLRSPLLSVKVRK